MIKTYIERKIYTEKVRPFMNKDIIKVFVGQRRVGKSYLLFQIMDLIKNDFGRDSNIIYINKEANEFENVKNHTDLLDFVKANTKKGKKNALFIDEIQDIKEFEKALRSLQSSGNYDIYCTGSNANLLSGELATYLSGRHIEIEVFGLSYNEFLLFHKLQKNKESLLKYIKYGGLPYLIHLSLEDDTVYEYLKNIYNTILLKDVVSRYKIRNVYFLDKLVRYLADNVGSLVSAKKISDFLKSQKSPISPSVVLDYLSFLVSTFLFFKVSRFEINGKKIFEVNEKYYFEDLGVRHSLIGYRQIDINKILENLVFLHLKRLGYNVSVGRLGVKEVDFVGEKNGVRLYIQVAYLLNSKAVSKREFGNLLDIPDNYRKIVVSMDEMAEGQYKGVEHINIIDFLCINSF